MTALTAQAPGLAAALRAIAATAAERDRDDAGAFPEDAVADLEATGALACTLGPQAIGYADELSLLRAVAAADTGVARILDGHLNAVERLRVQAPAALRDRELDAIAAGRLRAGVWGADPVGDEGEPAQLRHGAVTGVKVFCSGAGGLDRALVLCDDAASPGGAKLAAWVDLTAAGAVAVDRAWFRGAGMRSSASHRVVFDRAPVLAVLGPPGALLAQPWFARDVVRTAATWAGAADAAVEDAVSLLAARPVRTELEALAAGRLATWRHGMGLWLEDAARAVDDEPARVAAQLATAIADAARSILDEAERATGSRPAATGARLDRAARDLRLFLLQHRLEPILARTGRRTLDGDA